MSWTTPGGRAVPGERLWTLSDHALAVIRNVSASSAASTAWPSANLAIFLPFQLVRPWTVRRAFWYTGATAGGNVDLGIYRADTLAKVVSTGGLSRGSTSSFNVGAITATYLGPGEYYMALAVSSTNTIFSLVPAAGYCQSLGICEMASAYTLPATATLSLTTRANIPMFGFSETASPDL